MLFHAPERLVDAAMDMRSNRVVFAPGTRENAIKAAKLAQTTEELINAISSALDAGEIKDKVMTFSRDEIERLVDKSMALCAEHTQFEPGTREQAIGAARFAQNHDDLIIAIGSVLGAGSGKLMQPSPGEVVSPPHQGGTDA